MLLTLQHASKVRPTWSSARAPINGWVLCLCCLAFTRFQFSRLGGSPESTQLGKGFKILPNTYIQRSQFCGYSISPVCSQLRRWVSPSHRWLIRAVELTFICIADSFSLLIEYFCYGDWLGFHEVAGDDCALRNRGQDVLRSCGEFDSMFCLFMVNGSKHFLWLKLAFWGLIGFNYFGENITTWDSCIIGSDWYHLLFCFIYIMVQEMLVFICFWGFDGAR